MGALSDPIQNQEKKRGVSSEEPVMRIDEDECETKAAEEAEQEEEEEEEREEPKTQKEKPEVITGEEEGHDEAQEGVNREDSTHAGGSCSSSNSNTQQQQMFVLSGSDATNASTRQRYEEQSVKEQKREKQEQRSTCEEDEDEEHCLASVLAYQLPECTHMHDPCTPNCPNSSSISFSSSLASSPSSCASSACKRRRFSVISPLLPLTQRVRKQIDTHHGDMCEGRPVKRRALSLPTLGESSAVAVVTPTHTEGSSFVASTASSSHSSPRSSCPSSSSSSHRSSAFFVSDSCALSSSSTHTPTHLSHFVNTPLATPRPHPQNRHHVSLPPLTLPPLSLTPIPSLCLPASLLEELSSNNSILGTHLDKSDGADRENRTTIRSKPEPNTDTDNTSTSNIAVAICTDTNTSISDTSQHQVQRPPSLTDTHAYTHTSCQPSPHDGSTRDTKLLTLLDSYSLGSHPFLSTSRTVELVLDRLSVSQLRACETPPCEERRHHDPVVECGLVGHAEQREEKGAGHEEQEQERKHGHHHHQSDVLYQQYLLVRARPFRARMFEHRMRESEVSGA